jgi:predicted XRE-type DNA-binding protein
MKDEDLTVQRVDDLFAALDIPEPAEERARVDLASAITLEIRRRGLSQRAAARLLGVSQPDISGIMNARVSGFSQERLERLLNALDLEVRIQVGPRPAWKEHAGVTVELVETF